MVWIWSSTFKWIIKVRPKVILPNTYTYKVYGGHYGLTSFLVVIFHFNNIVGLLPVETKPLRGGMSNMAHSAILQRKFWNAYPLVGWLFGWLFGWLVLTDGCIDGRTDGQNSARIGQWRNQRGQSVGAPQSEDFSPPLELRVWFSAVCMGECPKVAPSKTSSVIPFATSFPTESLVTPLRLDSQ